MMPLLPLATSDPESFRRTNEATGYRMIEGQDLGRAMEAVGEGTGGSALFGVLTFVFLAAAFFSLALILWRIYRHAVPRAPAPPPSLPPDPGIRDFTVEIEDPKDDPKVKDRSRWREL